MLVEHIDDMIWIVVYSVNIVLTGLVPFILLAKSRSLFAHDDKFIRPDAIIPLKWYQRLNIFRILAIVGMGILALMEKSQIFLFVTGAALIGEALMLMTINQVY